MSQTSSAPNFAYPAKVEATARQQYARCLAEKNYNGALRALMDAELARTSIDSDSLQSAITAVEDFARLSAGSDASALSWLLAAVITNDAYKSLRGVYDRREQPLLPLGDDMTLWSGEQFRYKIRALCDSAVAAGGSATTPLESYGNVLNVSRSGKIICPTMGTFVNMKVIEILESLVNWAERLPLSAMCCADELSAEVKLLHSTRPDIAYILSLYDNVLKVNGANAGSYIWFEQSRLSFTMQRMYGINREQALVRRNQILEALMKRFAGSEFTCEILGALAEDVNPGDENAPDVYVELKKAIHKFPEYSRINILKNELDNLTCRKVSVQCRTLVAPGDSLEVIVKSSNADCVYVNLYRLPDNLDYNYSYASIDKAVAVGRRTVRFDAKVPFEEEGKVTFTFTRPGRFIVVPDIDGVKRDRDGYPVITVSSLCSGLLSFDASTVVVVDPVSGAPVKGAELTFFSDRRNDKKKHSLGKTDSDGLKNVGEWQNGYVIARKGDDRSAAKYIWRVGKGDENARSVQIFTDLAIYRPGDTVQWACVATKALKNKKSPVADTRMSVVMKDANGEEVDTVTVTTDALGRASGSFVVPQGRLTGWYSIHATTVGLLHKSSGGVGFTVSDYKLASYYTEFTSTEQQTPDAGDVTLKGRVVTYSGVPLAGVTAKLVLSSLPNWWWGFGGSEKFYAAEVTTDIAGEFKFVVKAQDFAMSPDEYGVFNAQVDVTSVTGESHSAATVFSRGAQWRIVPKLETDICVDAPVLLNVKVVDADGESVDREIYYSVNSDGNSCARGSFLPGREVNLAGVGSGIYEFVFSLNKDMSDSVSVTDIALYSINDSLPPRHTPVWIPKRELTSGNKILIGASRDSSNVLYTLWTSGQILERRWFSYPAGIHEQAIVLPNGVDQATATFMCVSEYESSVIDVKIERTDVPSPLKISIESMRDRLTPGNAERWTIRINRSGSEAAVMLDMFNDALSEFGRHNFSLYPAQGYVYRMNVQPPEVGNILGSSLFEHRRWLGVSQISVPELNTYGRGFGTHLAYGMPRLYGARSVATEAIAESDYAVEEKAGMNVAQTAMAVSNDAMAKNLVADDMAEEEAATEEDTGAAEVQGEKSGFSYRRSEVPSAFFAPMLTTSSDGSVEYSFTVPDANTTWVLQALAYTGALETATYEKKLVAAKPVMVKPNLPRFVRTGDTVVVESQIFNMGSQCTATVLTELFNPLDGNVTKSLTDEVALDSAGSATVSATVEAPLDAPFIGFRVKVRTGEFADGEQSVIEVLPSSEPVYESQTFYLADTVREYGMALPDYTADAKVTLSYCDNPIWYVLAALPGLREGEMRTSPDAAAAIFSAAVSRGLVKKYPAIEMALKEWTASDKSDEVLTSMLSRNEDMKMILLAATPWMADAAGDTERMQRLSLLLDEKECDTYINKGVNLLKKLAKNSGGIGWNEGFSRESLWATEMVLAQIGRARTLGYMPDDKQLEKLCEAALKYLELEYGRLCAKYPDTYLGTYAYIVSLWRDKQPGSLGKSMIAKALQQTVAHWSEKDVIGKTEAALLLARYDHFAVGREILKSVEEFALTSPEKGMWWPGAGDRIGTINQLLCASRAIEAYCLLQPGAPQIDKIRQWLILQKQTMNWGGSSATTEIVCAILASSQKWVAPAGEVSVTVGGDVVPAVSTSLFGEMKVQLPLAKASGAELIIKRSGNTPAWGAVSSVDIRSMSEVKSAGGNGIEIAKRVLVADSTGWRALGTGESLKVGDKVKIQLQIVNERILDYVTIIDNRAACLEPVAQMPGNMWYDGVCFYRENGDSSTRIFIDRLPKGSFVLEYEMWVNNAGQFASGIATVQSQYAPEISAHSAGTTVKVIR